MARDHTGSTGTTVKDRVPAGSTAPGDITERRIGYRWTICALLFFATTVNYVDRQVFSILAPTLQSQIGWTETQYGDITSAFTMFYGFGFLFMGRFMDWVGVRRG